MVEKKVVRKDNWGDWGVTKNQLLPLDPGQGAMMGGVEE
jgi:hypothetical protein